jgi:arabinan endo-1,5-alpha-L-arabinosidase
MPDSKIMYFCCFIKIISMRFIFAITFLFFLTVHAQEKALFYRSTGSLQAFNKADIDSISFDTQQMRLIIHKPDKSTTSLATSTIDSIKFYETPVVSYSPPTYADDYASISSWTNRPNWNLANVHDPTVAKDGNYYYMYQTDASYGNVLAGRGHYPYRRSADLVNWTFLGFAMPNTPPTWVKDSLNAMRARVGLTAIANPLFGYWAPVVRKVGNKFRLYYSMIVDNYIQSGLPNTEANYDGSWTERAFIGMMETESLQSNVWVDKGYVIHSVSERGTNWSRASLSDWSAYFRWNAIDPTYVETPLGEHWLIYGSWHSGIPAVKINPETGKPYQLNSLADYGVRVARRQNSDANRWQAQEGAEVIYNPKTGYYYMFLAYDELSVAYNTRVCRATNVTGPYYGINGANVSAGADCWPILTHPYKFNNHSGWVGFSHCGVFQDTESGQWYYTSQARLPAGTGGNAYANAIMMGHVRKIVWTGSGWPVVLPQRYANVPQTIITDNDLIGTWEHITLSYSYQNQRTSTTLTLGANYIASGALSGVWSYNAHTKTLTIGTTQLRVERELDWEANPRVPTIVYAGLNTSGHSLWGKKLP